jgi:hypothetical protein
MQRLRDVSKSPTYALPKIGRPPDSPMLRKIAIEEHFNFTAIDEPSIENLGLADVVRAMDYDRASLDLVGSRLTEFHEKPSWKWMRAESTWRTSRAG